MRGGGRGWGTRLISRRGRREVRRNEPAVAAACACGRRRGGVGRVVKVCVVMERIRGNRVRGNGGVGCRRGIGVGEEEVLEWRSRVAAWSDLVLGIVVRRHFVTVAR